MDFGNLWNIIGLSISCGLLAVLIALFFISRRSQRVMQSLMDIMMDPTRSRVSDATRVLNAIMAEEIKKIIGLFQNMQETLHAQIAAADALKNELGQKNNALVATANDAIMRVAQMSGRMDNTVAGLRSVVNSDSWNDAANATDRFASVMDETLNKISATTTDSTDKIATIDEKISGWTAAAEKLTAMLSAAIESNTDQFDKMIVKSDVAQEHIGELGKSASTGFNEIKDAATNYETVLKNTGKSMTGYLAKLDSFDKQSKKQLNNQMTTLTNTANLLGAQVMLTESSVEKQIRKLTDAVEAVLTSATETEGAVRGITNELAGLTNHFEGEIRGFATDVVDELKTVSGVANTTLNDTKTAANAFSESVKSMATGVRETLIEMNTAHTQLTGQSEGLIKMSVDTTAQLRPLSELIEKYYSALPDLAKTSGNAGAALTKIVSELNDKIANIRTTVEQSTQSVSESAGKLENLAGQSRQQMIELMSDYAHAVETMQTLNRQMAVARAAAPMDAIGVTPAVAPAPRASSRDFIAQSNREFDKMYEQTIDLTRAMGVDIPDIVWKKYHDGDNKIFAKWMAKMVRATNKKQIRELIKNDSVFKSQSTQFVRSFDKILNAAKQTDTPDKLTTALVKTDLGVIYSALSSVLD